MASQLEEGQRPLNGYDVVRATGPARIEVRCTANGIIRAGVVFNDSGVIEHVAVEPQPSAYGPEALQVLQMVLIERAAGRVS